MQHRASLAICILHINNSAYESIVYQATHASRQQASKRVGGGGGWGPSHQSQGTPRPDPPDQGGKPRKGAKPAARSPTSNPPSKPPTRTRTHHPHPTPAQPRGSKPGGGGGMSEAQGSTKESAAHIKVELRSAKPEAAAT